METENCTTHLMFISSTVLHLTVLSLRGCSCTEHHFLLTRNTQKKNNRGNLSEEHAVRQGGQKDMPPDTKVNLEKALTFPAWLESTKLQRDELPTLTQTHLRRFRERLSCHKHSHTHTGACRASSCGVHLVQCVQFIQIPSFF